MGRSLTGDAAQPDGWSGYFESLGRETERRWAAAGRAKGGFAEVAAGVLAEVPVPVGLDPTALLEEVVARGDLPRQEDPGAAFGEPPLTMFRGDEFFVSALYWLDGTTTIHQHSFIGAFRVLSGSSLHVPYGFEVREAVSDKLRLGALQIDAPEALRQGDTRTIEYGDAFIHSLFHLDRPSVTVLVRTYSDRTPQPVYLQPGLAFDPVLRDDAMRRRFQSLMSLQALDGGAARRAAQAYLEDEDAWAGFLLLMQWADRVDRGESLSDLVAVMRRRHGEVTEVLWSALVEAQRASAITMRRRMFRDPEQRLFLALLLNLPDLSSINSVLRQIYPERQPGDLLADWLTDFSHPRINEMTGLSLQADAVARLAQALRMCDSRALHGIAASARLPRMLGPLLA